MGETVSRATAKNWVGSEGASERKDCQIERRKIGRMMKGWIRGKANISK